VGKKGGKRRGKLSKNLARGIKSTLIVLSDLGTVTTTIYPNIYNELPVGFLRIDSSTVSKELIDALWELLRSQ
jgi:hypothetical protein